MTKAALIMVIVFLTASSVYFYMQMSIAWQPQQISYIDKSMSNQHEPPYKYRPLVPAISRALDQVTHSHLTTQAILAVLVFGFMYYACYRWFRSLLLVDYKASLLIIGALVHISITPYWVLDDFLTLGIYALAMILAANKKPVWIIAALLFVGMWNREQIIFLAFMLWYAMRWCMPNHANYISHKKVHFTGLFYVLVCIAGYVLPRLIFGYEPSRFTPALHFDHNTTNFFNVILPLWLAFLVPIWAFAIYGCRGKGVRRKQILFLMVIYTGLFFFNGNMWELGKYLPALLWLLPLALMERVNGD
jgi:hypothetical protein